MEPQGNAADVSPELEIERASEDDIWDEGAPSVDDSGDQAAEQAVNKGKGGVRKKLTDEEKAKREADKLAEQAKKEAERAAAKANEFDAKSFAANLVKRDVAAMEAKAENPSTIKSNKMIMSGLESAGKAITTSQSDVLPTLVHSVTGFLTAQSMNAIPHMSIGELVTTWQAVNELDTAGWLTRACTAHYLINRVRDEIKQSGKSGEGESKVMEGVRAIAEGYKREVLGADGKPVLGADGKPKTEQVSGLGVGLKTLTDLADTYNRFLTGKVYEDENGNPIPDDIYKEACKWLSYSIFVEAKKYQKNPGLALSKLLSVKLSDGVLSVRQAREIVQKMFDVDNPKPVLTSEPPVVSGDAQNASTAPAPAPEAGVRRFKPGQLVGDTPDMVNAIISASQELEKRLVGKNGAPANPLAEVYVYTDSSGNWVYGDSPFIKGQPGSGVITIWVQLTSKGVSFRTGCHEGYEVFVDVVTEE